MTTPPPPTPPQESSNYMDEIQDSTTSIEGGKVLPPPPSDDNPSEHSLSSVSPPPPSCKERITAVPHKKEEEDHMQLLLKPSWVSLSIVLLNCSLGVTSFLIVLPTSANYTSSFGINNQLAGLLVGLSPLINGLVQPMLIPIFRRFRLLHIFEANCLLTMLGNSLYALGDVTNSFGILLLGRCILGISGGPAFATTYTARATHTSIRTQYMGYTAVSVSSGYVFGPLLAFLSERIVQAAHWDSQLLNSNTLPGWIVVIGALFNLFLFVFLFEEPPRPSQSQSAHQGGAATEQQQVEAGTAAVAAAAALSETFSATSIALEETDVVPVPLEEDAVSTTTSEDNVPSISQDDEENNNNNNYDSITSPSSFWSLKTLQIAICYLFIAVTMANTGSFEISLVFRGEEDWDLTISHISLILAAFNVITIALSFVRLEERFVGSDDRKGILICFLGLLLGSPFLLDYHNDDTPAAVEVTLVAVGGLLQLFSAQTAKGFLFGLASKVPSPTYQQTVISFMVTAYTFGRFAGTLVAPFLFDHSNAYGGFLLGMNSLCCILFLVFYRHMEGKGDPNA